MSRARLIALTCLGAVLCVASASFANPVPARLPAGRLFLVALDGTSIQDWESSGGPALHSFMKEASIALMSSRPRSSVRCADRSQAARQVLFGGAGEPQTVSYFASSETLAADCLRIRGRAIRDSLATADTTISFVTSQRSADDVVIVASTVAPFFRERGHDTLTPIAISGAGFSARASLTSASTRRAGVITLQDLVATFIAPNRGTGLHIERAPPRSSVADDAWYWGVARARIPILKSFVYLAALLIALAAWTVMRGRRRGRRSIAFGLRCVAAAPVAMLLQPLIHLWTPGPIALSIAGVALAIALSTQPIDQRNRFPLIAAITLIVIVGDLAFGAPLSSHSVLSYTIADGSRFYGIGNELMGLAVIASLVWASGALDRGAKIRAPIAAVLATLSVLMVTPTLGAKFGSTFVTIPAFGLFLLAAWEKAATRRNVTGVAIATTLLGGLAVALDRSLRAGSQSHLARIASGSKSAVAWHKLGAALRLLAGSYWTHGLAVSLIVIAILLWKHQPALARAAWGYPYLRAALVGGAIAALTSIAFNDAGVIAASLIVMIGTAAFLEVMLIGHTTISPSWAATTSKP